MKQGIKRPGALLLLLLTLLLAVSGVSAGLIFRSSNSVAKYPSLIDATIDTLTAGLASKKFTSVDLVKAYLSRIAEVNETLHAVTEVNPDALIDAAKLDVERSAGSIRGPLHGIPLLIKNNIATNDRMNTTAGSWALVGAKVPRDATVVQKLRGAGAILLGKTNLSQWANYRSLNSSNGWSALGGQGYGPYFPNEDPWGSSSGNGIASALGLALGCLGTETDGSIIDPSSFNNLVGIKPTVGLTSRHLVIPVSEHQDTVGPMARTVKDAAYILQAIAGKDPRDNYTSAIPGGVLPDYVASCKLSALSGTRLGIPRNVISLRSDNTTGPMMEAFEKALGVLQAAGATIVEDTNFPAAAEFQISHLPTVILNADFVVNLESYLGSLTHNPRNITSLASLREFTRSFPLEDYPTRDTGLWDAALQGWNNTDPRFWPAYQQNLYYGDDGGVLGAIERNRLDAVILPSKFAADWAATVGSPIVTVPLGFYPAGVPVVKNSWNLVESAPNIPFGFSFLGAKFTEAKLIGMAYAFEQRTKVRDKVQPYIVPKTELSNVVGKYGVV
ncbi:amidase [Hyaloscypha sp. PMI_1271]|nr:amidase [Hyaloscypha sp. PMI_1271]